MANLEASQRLEAPLGLVDCQGEAHLDHKPSTSPGVSDDDSKLPYKRSLELWSHKSGEPKQVIDWSEQTFRMGQPSLSSLRCSEEGLIYGNLFWGSRPWTLGVGLLIIDPKKERSTVWERRQGYDGEESLSKTPLLPHSDFNTIRIASERSPISRRTVA